MTGDLASGLQTLGPIVRAHVLTMYREDSCIASTAIGIGVLAGLGVDARPLAVVAGVFNAPMQARLRREGQPGAPEDVRRWYDEDGSWSVGIGLGADPRPDRWPGHLVAIVDERFLWDLSIDQASRPEKGMLILPWGLVAPVEPDFLSGREQLSGGTGGLKIVYQARPDDRSYATSINWVLDESVNARLVARVLDQIGHRWEGINA